MPKQEWWLDSEIWPDVKAQAHRLDVAPGVITARIDELARPRRDVFDLDVALRSVPGVTASWHPSNLGLNVNIPPHATVGEPWMSDLVTLTQRNEPTEAMQEDVFLRVIERLATVTRPPHLIVRKVQWTRWRTHLGHGFVTAWWETNYPQPIRLGERDGSFLPRDWLKTVPGLLWAWLVRRSPVCTERMVKATREYELAYPQDGEPVEVDIDAEWRDGKAQVVVKRADLVAYSLWTKAETPDPQGDQRALDRVLAELRTQRPLVAPSRWMAVLPLVSLEGLTSEQIGLQLGIPKRTVEDYRLDLRKTLAAVGVDTARAALRHLRAAP